MKKRIDLFLTDVDEHELTRKILEKFPNVVFADDVRWKTPNPDIRPSIDQCNSRYVLIWDRSIAPTLPIATRPDGTFEGPITAFVLFLTRSENRQQVLKSGTLLAGINDAKSEMVVFAKGVFRILQRVATYRAAAVDKSTGTILNDKVPSAVVGPDAARWCEEQPDRYMMFANSPYCFLRPLAPKKITKS